jgi:hypothetical protein
MGVHVDKVQAKRRPADGERFSLAGATGRRAAPLVDNRPATIAQRKLDESTRQNAHVQEAQLQPGTGTRQSVRADANDTGLPDNLKSGIESLSGYSMDQVKVHFNSHKPAQLQAHAYAQGTNIHLAPGQERHLPHEAWHVVQQMQGRVRPTLQMKDAIGINDDAGLEAEADMMGARAAQFGGGQARAGLQLKFSGKQEKVAQRAVLSKISGHWASNSDPMDVSGAPSKEDYVIDDVIIGGRTPSPFAGTMGAHSTAWIAHLDAVRRQLVGTTLGEGITWLSGMANHDLASPLLKLDGYLNPVQQANLGTARYHLQKHVEELQKFNDTNITKSNYSLATTWLRSTINAYLTYVNFLPMSTVAGGDPGGHGEGAARSELNAFEFAVSEKHRADRSNSATAEQFDPLPAKDLSGEDKLLGGINDSLKLLLRGTLTDGALIGYKKQIAETLVSMFAKETPEVYASSHRDLQSDAAKPEVWALALQNFLRTIRIAYPYAYDFARLAEEDVIKPLIKTLNGSLDEEVVYRYLTGQKRFTAISGTYTFHGEEAQKTENKNKIESELVDGHRVDQAEIRFSATGLSDIQQSGSSFGATVLVDPASGRIGDVVVNGRTKSPFSGTMGAHTTAWTVHVDAVIRLLKDRTLPEGIRALANRARSEMTENKALEYAGTISEKHQIFLVGGFNWLKQQIGTATGSIGGHDEKAMTDQLEALIHSYLNFVNLIPTSTIEVGRLPNGRSEGIHRTFLTRYEEEGDAVFTKKETAEERTGIILEHLSGMLDVGAVKDFPPVLGQREATDINSHVEGGYDSKHPLYRHISSAGSTHDKAAVVYENFLHTIEDAYPRAARAVHLDLKVKKKHPNVETSSDKRAKLLNKRAIIVRNPADPESSRYVGMQVEIKGVYDDNASVILLATHNLARVNVNVTSLALE